MIYRHEHTLSGPKADRLELLRHTRISTGQLFLIYSDAQKKVDAVLSEAESAAAPATEMTDEYGVMHRLWVIAEPERVKAIQDAMADQKLVIADGHHRYETALNYRNERRAQAGKIVADAPYERAMMTFINTQGAGLTILADTSRGGETSRFQLGGTAQVPGAVVQGGEVYVGREEFLRGS